VDATRHRRIRDAARQQWYAHWRLVRFARHFGFVAKASRVLSPNCVIGGSDISTGS